MHIIVTLNRQQAQKCFRVPLSEFQEVAKDAEGNAVLGFPSRWFGFEQDWRVLVTYRKANAEHQATTWADVRVRVLAKAQEWRNHPAAKEKTLWRTISRVITVGVPGGVRGEGDLGRASREAFQGLPAAHPGPPEGRGSSQSLLREDRGHHGPPGGGALAP